MLFQFVFIQNLIGVSFTYGKQDFAIGFSYSIFSVLGFVCLSVVIGISILEQCYIQNTHCLFRLYPSFCDHAIRELDRLELSGVLVRLIVQIAVRMSFRSIDGATQAIVLLLIYYVVRRRYMLVFFDLHDELDVQMSAAEIVKELIQFVLCMSPYHERFFQVYGDCIARTSRSSRINYRPEDGRGDSDTIKLIEKFQTDSWRNPEDE